MVAYTSPDCIPYFEGGDSVCLNTGSLCEPSTVWCDAAQVVEAKLDLFDSVVARTATSVPMAWAETTEPVTVTVGGDSTVLIPFTTVRIDTDNMVNLDVDNAGFTFQTPGLYLLWGHARGTTATSLGAGNTFDASLVLDLSGDLSRYGPVATGTLEASMEVAVNDVQIAMNILMVLPVPVAGTRLIASFNYSGVGGDAATFNEVNIGAVWMADAP